MVQIAERVGLKSVAAVLARHESLDACFNGGVDERLLRTQCLLAKRAHEGILAAELLHERRPLVIGLDYLDIGRKGGLGRSPRQDGHVELVRIQ